MALIKRGEALRADIHYRLAELDKDIVKAQIEQAQKAYKSALEKAGDNNTIIVMAKFGLAICAEELGKFDEAMRIYREIADNPDFDAISLTSRARLRLDTIDDGKDKFVFVKASEIPAEKQIDTVVTETVDAAAAEAETATGPQP